MKISVIIPVYKVEKYIKACLDSVIAQTYSGEIECILVDDCSPDDSSNIIEDVLRCYRGSISFKLIHHDCNKGLSSARNTGISNATGEYVYFLDSDDEITPDCLKKLAAPLSDNSYDLVIGDFKTKPENIQFDSLLSLESGEIRGRDILSSYVYKRYYEMAWNKLCNKAFIYKYNLFFKEGLLHEDELWSFEVACRAQSMWIVNSVTYIYKIRNGSIMMNGALRLHSSALFLVIEDMLSYTKPLDKQKKHLLYPYILLFLKRNLHTIYMKGARSDFKWGYAKAKSAFLQIPFGWYFRDGTFLKGIVSIVHFFFPVFLGRLYYCFLHNFTTNKNNQVRW